MNTKKAKKKTKSQRRTELDRITAQLHKVLRRRTKDVILAGNFLMKARELRANEHSKWLLWLEKNFDLTERTARRYTSAAAYVARKSDTVSADFSNLAPTVLYWLAAGHYNEQEEAEILAATRKGRVDQDAAWAICEKLASPDDAEDADEGDEQEPSGEDGDDGEPAEDPESAAILDGPPPDVQPTENLPPENFALRDFNQAIDTLKRLMTKPSAQFAGTSHSADDLEKVEAFIHAVTKAGRQ